jgi:predicted lipase
LATLMSALLAQSVEAGRRNLQLTMYNYGSPRVGNGAFVQQYNRLVPDSFRVRSPPPALSKSWERVIAQPGL